MQVNPSLDPLLPLERVQSEVRTGHPPPSFDAVIVTCASEQVPQAPMDQLKLEGRMIIPVGPQDGVQELILLRKTATGLGKQAVMPVRFVPMVGNTAGQ
jgi:protein-L-isoaspartate O-methyltransferase